MSAEYTVHPARVSRDSNNAGALVAYGPQVGNAVTVADGGASAAFAGDGVVRVRALSNVRVRVGKSLTNGDGGARLLSGEVMAFDVLSGEVLGVSVLA